MAENLDFHITVVGLRDLQGRFASLRDTELAAMQLEEAERTAKTLEEVFRRHAPKSTSPPAGGHQHFAEGITGQAVATGTGFEITLTTDNPDLRRWLAEGTGVYGPRGARIYPRHASALGPIFGWAPGGSGPLWFTSIAGMKAQPWEAEADAEAAPFGEKMGNLIGSRVVLHLSGT